MRMSKEKTIRPEESHLLEKGLPLNLIKMAKQNSLAGETIRELFRLHMASHFMVLTMTLRSSSSMPPHLE